MKEQSKNNDLNKKFENFSYPVGDVNWDMISARIPSGSGNGFLGKKFSEHSVSPSRQVWRGIEATLLPVSRRRIAAWWWYGAAAAVFLLGYFSFQQFYSNESRERLAHTQDLKIISDDTSVDTTKDYTVSIETENEQLKSSPSSAKANTTAITDKFANSQDNSSTGSWKFENAPYKNKGLTAKADKAAAQQNEMLQIAEMSPADENISKSEGSASRMSKLEIIGTYSAIETPQLSQTLAGEMITVPKMETAANKKQKSSRFYDGTERSSENQFAILAGSQLAFAGNGDLNMDKSKNSFDNTEINIGTGAGLADSSVPTSVSYATPIYYGINGEIKFWKRLSAGLGIGYLHLKATTESNTEIQTLVKESQTKYISIPVYLKFNFVDKPKFTAYTSAGNAIDLLIWENTTQTFFDGQSTESTEVSDEPKGNQANLYAGLGMSFKFTKHLGIFAEGSLMRYYSITGSNFYSQQDLWPGMKFGALVTF